MAVTNNLENLGVLITITGSLSGKTILIPNVNLHQPQTVLIHDRKYSSDLSKADEQSNFEIDARVHYPDVRSFKRKFGLLLPATNTSLESELWSIIYNNPHSLRGVGIHTSNVLTPNPRLQTEQDLANYKTQFLGGVQAAIQQSLLAEPQYLIMGMSLEHIIGNLKEIKQQVKEAEAVSVDPKTGIQLSWATWHDAVHAALNKYQAKKIGLLTPFDKKGNENASRMFMEMGYDVISSVGFSCANAIQIAHVPDWAKEKAIMEFLIGNNKLDAVVQCGTNMSLINVTEKLEPVLGIPILGINAVTFWYALRENGFSDPISGGGRLLRDF